MAPKTLPKLSLSKGTKEEPKRLTPTPEVLRELYLLSGNNCAMPGCDGLIIDAKGVVVGQVCHVRAAKPDGARFDDNMDNEQRRAVSNLVMMCGGHHKQIDSKQYESEYTLKRVAKIKADHEARFKGIDDSLRQSFQTEYVDGTDNLNPSAAKNFAKLESVLPDCIVVGVDAADRKKQLDQYIDDVKKVPDAERRFMLAVIKRAIKLNKGESVLVHVDDLMSALKITSTKLNSLGSALKRYNVGDLDLYGMGGLPDLMALGGGLVTAESRPCEMSARVES